MITLITGVPGAGKSLRCMWRLATDDAYKGRPVYSNMAGAGGGLPDGHLPLPETWMQCPDGSVVVIDECQHRWPQRGPGSKVPAEEGALDTHRHRGIDFIVMTQRPTGISHHVRGLVGLHEHLKRKFGLEMSYVMSKGEAFDPSDFHDREFTDAMLWRFPKSFYGSYLSSVDHTGAYRFRMPRKAVVGGAVIGVMVLVSLVGGWYAVRRFRGGVKGGAAVASLPASAARPLAAGASSADVVRAQGHGGFDAVAVASKTVGCAAMGGHVTCYDRSGAQEDLNQVQAREVMRRPGFFAAMGGTGEGGASFSAPPSVPVVDVRGSRVGGAS